MRSLRHRAHPWGMSTLGPWLDQRCEATANASGLWIPTLLWWAQLPCGDTTPCCTVHLVCLSGQSKLRAGGSAWSSSLLMQSSSSRHYSPQSDAVQGDGVLPLSAADGECRESRSFLLSRKVYLTASPWDFVIFLPQGPGMFSLCIFMCSVTLTSHGCIKNFLKRNSITFLFKGRFMIPEPVHVCYLLLWVLPLKLS